MGQMTIKNLINFFFLVLLSNLLTQGLFAHENHGKAHYLANEGVLIDNGTDKLLFDPFFHNDFGSYVLVPKDIREAIFAGAPPYNDIKAIFISHAHEDHFDAKDTMTYMLQHKIVQLYAPKQAIDLLRPHKKFDLIKERIQEVVLQRNDKPLEFKLGKLTIDAVRIPHAGWPNNSHVENIIYRVGGENSKRVMHFGDADANKEHYGVYNEFWQKYLTDVTFVPFWFGLSPDGNELLKSTLNTKQAIGLHVPKVLPNYMQHMAVDYFHKPGDTRDIK